MLVVVVVVVVVVIVAIDVVVIVDVLVLVVIVVVVAAFVLLVIVVVVVVPVVVVIIIVVIAVAAAADVIFTVVDAIANRQTHTPKRERKRGGKVVVYRRLVEARIKSRRHRGGPEDKRVGSVAASLQRASGGPPFKPPLCHPVAEGRLASIVAASLWRAAGAMFVGYRCTDGFHVYRNECLYIGSTYVTWNEAQGFWDSLNSSMLTIQDATKYNIVKSE